MDTNTIILIVGGVVLALAMFAGLYGYSR